MKAVVQNLKTGKLTVDDVPPPALRPEGILVAVRRSVISLGTERSVIALANKGPIGKAQQRPDLARKVLNKAKQEGFWSTYKVVKNLIASPIPLGYSCAGEVIAVGAEVDEFRVGDRVACYGLNFANHAEVNYIPRNLAVKIPDGLADEHAAFVAIGSIAMQGVRLAELELGERVVVMGLGLVGQIAAQLARCNGASVLATDLDPKKCEMAMELGAHLAVSDPQEVEGAVANFTDGHGADAVLVCAASKSNDLLRSAAEMSRLKGRVIIVGDVGLDLERRPFFDKEVRLVISRSSGPGRFDPEYEVHGHDYPLPYVRWTERRNGASFLELAARGDVNVSPLVTHHYPIERAEEAYRIVTGEDKQPAIAIVLDYQPREGLATKVALGGAREALAPVGEVHLGVIGAGQFAKGVLLPAFAAQSGVHLRGFCTSSGLTSKDIAEKYGASFCTSDPEEVVASEAVNALVVTTRHDQHAPLVLSALRADKAVFVEKPLCIRREDLEQLQQVGRTRDPRLMVGFNRRFSPLAVRCREFFAGTRDPLHVFYRVNAGQLPADSWVYDPVQGGGRILGEVCHFVDMLCFLTGSLPKRVHAEPIEVPGAPDPHRDSVCVNLRMRNDALGVIHYVTSGDPSVSKEYLEVYGGQRTAILDNYRTLALHQGNKRRTKKLVNQQKGFAEEVAAFVRALRDGAPMPIPYESLIAVTQTCFLIHESLDQSAPVEYEDPGLPRPAL